MNFQYIKILLFYKVYKQHKLHLNLFHFKFLLINQNHYHYFLKDQIITKDDIKVIRPAFGLDPIFYDKIIGKKAKTNIKKYSRLKISQIQI